MSLRFSFISHMSEIIPFLAFSEADLEHWSGALKWLLRRGSAISHGHTTLNSLVPIV